MSPKVQFSSRSTLHRMVNGVISEELAKELHPIAAACLKQFLIERGLNAAEIDNELTTIFNGGEYQPMSFKKIRLSYRELAAFGLPADPFKNDPEKRSDVYMPGEYREVFDAVIDAAMYRHFIAVLSPVGSSKSTLQDYVRDHITRETSLKIVWPEFYNQARLTPTEIARSILQSLGVQKIPQRSTALAKAVTDHLRLLTEEGNRVAIVIDNCHEMSQDAVRSLKKFIEMSSGGFQRYLGIILFGWPDFESMIKLPEFTEIYERLHVLTMPPFERDNDGKVAVDRKISEPLFTGYLEHRFKVIGCDLADYFDEDAVQYIAANSTTPLQCGNITNRAIQISIDKYDNKKVIGAAIRKHLLFDTPNGSEPAFKRR